LERSTPRTVPRSGGIASRRFSITRVAAARLASAFRAKRQSWQACRPLLHLVPCRRLMGVGADARLPSKGAARRTTPCSTFECRVGSRCVSSACWRARSRCAGPRVGALRFAPGVRAAARPSNRRRLQAVTSTSFARSFKIACHRSRRRAKCSSSSPYVVIVTFTRPVSALSSGSLESTTTSPWP
jgi:hypothetical protein